MPRPPTGSGDKELRDYRAKEPGRAIAPAPSRPAPSIHNDQRRVHDRPQRPSNTPQGEQALAAELPPGSTRRHQGVQLPLAAEHSTPHAVILEEIAMNSFAPSPTCQVHVLTALGGYVPALASVNLWATSPQSLPMLKSRIAEACMITWDWYNPPRNLRTTWNDPPVLAIGLARNVRITTDPEFNPRHPVVLPFCMIVEPENEISIQDLCLNLHSAVALFQQPMPGVYAQSVGSNMYNNLSVGHRRITGRHASRHPRANRGDRSDSPSRRERRWAHEMLPHHASAILGGDTVYRPSLLRQIQDVIPDWQLGENHHVEEEGEEEEQGGGSF